MSGTPRILLADDHEMFRQGLRSLLESGGHFEVVGEAVNGREAVKMARDLEPEVIVMDAAMPELNGIEAARQITRDHERIRVLILSMHSDPTYVGRALEAGASGYLLKDGAYDELEGAIRSALIGRTYLGNEVSDVVVDDYVRRLRGETSDDRASVLTPKEREVLQMIAEGSTTKEIAARLHVSVKTIETHRQNIMRRLELRSIAQLTKFAIREGLTSPDP